MPLSHRFLRTVRTLHLYLGVFTAPMLIFFAVTGGLQTFGLHEGGRGSSYTPPAWLATMAQLHKKQTTVIPVRRPRPEAAERSATTSTPSADVAPASRARHDAQPEQKRRPGKNLWPMKIFFALVALGLLISVLTGLYMAWRFSRRPVIFSVTLAAGVVVPLLLLLI